MAESANSTAGLRCAPDFEAQIKRLRAEAHATEQFCTGIEAMQDIGEMNDQMVALYGHAKLELRRNKERTARVIAEQESYEKQKAEQEG
jgi:hypothetical protein